MSDLKITKGGAWPKTEDELVAYIREQAAGPHDYDTSARALTDIALAAFNYAGSALGNSGFQASWAALNFYGKTQHIDGPFGVVKAADLLFPQNDTPSAKASKWEREWAPWARDEAVKLLADHADGCNVAPRVWQHWLGLAGDAVPPGTPTLAEVEAISERQRQWWAAEDD